MAVMGCSFQMFLIEDRQGDWFWPSTLPESGRSLKTGFIFAGQYALLK